MIKYAVLFLQCKGGLKMKKKITSHFIINADKYILSLFLFTLGILSGFLIVYIMKEDKLSELITYINTYMSSFVFDESTSKQILIELIKETILIFLPICLLAFTNIGRYIAFLFIALKGFSFGFTSCVFIEAYLIKGLLFNIYVLFPPLIFEIISSSFLCSCICALSSTKSGFCNIKSVGAFSVLVFISIAVYSLGILYEAYISPRLIIGIAQNMV